MNNIYKGINHRLIMAKKIIFLLLFVFLFSLAPIMADNSVIFNTPANDTSISGATYLINASLDASSFKYINATFYYKIGAGSWVSIATVQNDTELQFQTIFDTTTLVDTSNMIFNVTLRNATGYMTSNISSSIELDNGNPTATLSSSHLEDITKLYSDTSFTFGIDADTDIGIESCTAYIGTTTKSLTASAEACSQSYTPSSFGVSAGDYSYFIQVFDGNNNQTNSSSRNLMVYSTTSQGGGSSQLALESQQDKPTEQQVGTPNGDNMVTRFINSIVDFFKNLFK